MPVKKEEKQWCIAPTRRRSLTLPSPSPSHNSSPSLALSLSLAPPPSLSRSLPLFHPLLSVGSHSLAARTKKRYPSPLTKSVAIERRNTHTHTQQGGGEGEEEGTSTTKRVERKSHTCSAPAKKNPQRKLPEAHQKQLIYQETGRTSLHTDTNRESRVTLCLPHSRSSLSPFPTPPTQKKKGGGKYRRL